MANETGHKTEQDVAPNFWKWMVVALCAVIVLALIGAAIFYYGRGRKENRQPPGVPQTLLVPPENKLFQKASWALLKTIVVQTQTRACGA